MHVVTVDLTLGQVPGSDLAAELRITLPSSPAPITPLLIPAPVAIDLTQLRMLALDPHAYGRALSSMLFADEALRAAFAQARAVGAQQAVPLRLCLTIRPEADELHAVRWECLTDPDVPERSLGADGQVLLSRTLPSADWNALAPRPTGPLRAVVLVAAPSDLADYGLPPIDAARESAWACAQLAGCALTALGDRTRATLPALLGQLHAGCDLLVLLAHGRRDEHGQTWLYLEDDAGDTVPTPGASLTARLGALADKPRLVILTACESAGDGAGATLATLGPPLVRAGVSAVLAMQGPISRETLSRFLLTCLQTLVQDGSIDRAVAIARAQVADQPDWWRPALWMRPGDGLLWSAPAVPAALSGPAQALHQLRAPVADFVGRSAEVERLVAALRSAAGGCAAISGVRGMGGLGKTELAYAVATQLRHEYPDAQLLLELRGASDTPLSQAQVLQQVIRAFRPEDKLPEEVAALQAIYRSVLAGKRALLLADDAKDAAQVRPLLPPVGCALLVTSRQRFILDGMTTLDLSRLDEAAAVTLLCGICTRLTEEQSRQIARLCGYLPLALRVSAGILLNDEALSVERYLARLADERQRLAHLKDPDDPTRDVEASLQLSYAGLDKQTQAHFRRLGVIAVDAALSLVAALLELPEDATDDILRALLRRSLVEYDATRERWGMHDLVRDCAFGLLVEADEERAARLRYVEQVIGIINEGNRCYQAGGDGVLQGLALFDHERFHLEAVRDWLWVQPLDDVTDALLIAEARATSSIGEIRDSPRMIRIPQLERALAAAQRQQHWHVQGQLLGKLGTTLCGLWEKRAAVSYHIQELAIARRIENLSGEASALCHLGTVSLVQGELSEALHYYEQALAITQQLGDRSREGGILCNLGVLCASLGNMRTAKTYYEQWLKIVQALGDRHGEGVALGNLGCADADLGEVRTALTYHEQHLTLMRILGDRRGEGVALGNLGSAYAKLGETQQAITCLEQQLLIVQAFGDHRGEAAVLSKLGNAYADQGDLVQALALTHEAVRLFCEVDDRRSEASVLNLLGRVDLLQGKREEALTHSTTALSLARGTRNRQVEGMALHTIAAVCVALDQPAEADTHFAASLAVLEEIEHQPELARTRWDYGQFLVNQGDRTRGINLMVACVAYEQRIGHAKTEEHAALVERLRVGGELLR